jgi:NADH-quinone oxidoreductase subunit H
MFLRFLLGGIRGAAQMISYELALGLSLVPIVMLADSLSIVEIVKAQEKYPFILVQPFAFVIFMISAMAESKRIPFDMPEAENELGAGYHTEYSGIRFWWRSFFWAAGGAPFCRPRYGFLSKSYLWR